MLHSLPPFGPSLVNTLTLHVCIHASKVVRGEDGEVRCYPVVETVQLNNVCHTTLAPAVIEPKAVELAEAAAKQAVRSLWGAGVFGVELFLMKDGSVLLNEVAPR